MRSINKVILIGNLTRDPEVRQTPGGQNVVTFSIATNREWITKDGRRQNSTEFHDLVAWAKLADICEKHLKKSKLVYVEGYLKTRNWTTPEGQKKFRTEIVVQDLIMLDKRQKGADDSEEDYIPEEEADSVLPSEHSHEEHHHSTPEHHAGHHDDEHHHQPVQEEKPAPKGIKSTEPGSLDIDQDLGL